MAEQVQQLMIKDPKKVQLGKRLAEYSHRQGEELAQMKAQKSERETKITYFGAGVIVAIRVLGVIGYYVYQSKNPVDQPKEAPVHQHKKTPGNKSDMD